MHEKHSRSARRDAQTASGACEVNPFPPFTSQGALPGGTGEEVLLNRSIKQGENQHPAPTASLALAIASNDRRASPPGHCSLALEDHPRPWATNRHALGHSQALGHHLRGIGHSQALGLSYLAHLFKESHGYILLKPSHISSPLMSPPHSATHPPPSTLGHLLRLTGLGQLTVPGLSIFSSSVKMILLLHIADTFP